MLWVKGGQTAKPQLNLTTCKCVDFYGGRRIWRKTLKARERSTITLPHMSSDPSSRNNPGLYQGGRHPSSYNPNRLGLTSEISGELTAYAMRAPLPCRLVFPLQFPITPNFPTLVSIIVSKHRKCFLLLNPFYCFACLGGKG